MRAVSEGRFSITCSVCSVRAGPVTDCHAAVVGSCERLRYLSGKGFKSAQKNYHLMFS